MVGVGRLTKSSTGTSAQVLLAHQTRDTMTADVELSVNSWTAVPLLELPERRGDLDREAAILLRCLAFFSTTPRVKPARRHLQHLAQHVYWVMGALRLDPREP